MTLKTVVMPIQQAASQQLRNRLLLSLNDQQFHSGEALAAEFSLSRSAISNHIKALRDIGIEIYSVKGRGYKLATTIELLNVDALNNLLLADVKNEDFLRDKPEASVQVASITGSTNDLIKQQINKQSGLVCIAEAQTAGRGRRGRKWVSPFGSSIYMSMLWHFSDGYQAMSGLSLMVGVVLNQTLQAFGVDTCKLKWPNDLYYEQQKLAGILIEVEGQVGASASAIIGVGLNIKLPNDVKGIDQAFTDLSAINSSTISRNNFAAAFISHLWQALPQFEQQGLKPFMQSWEQADLYVNKPVVLISENNETRGISRGIDATGALLLEVNGNVSAYHGGEISVRAG